MTVSTELLKVTVDIGRDRLEESLKLGADALVSSTTLFLKSLMISLIPSSIFEYWKHLKTLVLGASAETLICTSLQYAR